MATADPESPAPSPTAPEPVRKPWEWGIGPHYIGLFLWVAFVDQLGVRTLPVGGLAPPVLGAAIAGALGFLLLYYAPAMWGLRSRRPLAGAAAATFGASGAPWVPGLLMGLVQVAWFAVALHYGVDFTFRGLEALRVLDPRHLRPWAVGGLTLRGPLFLAVSAAWSVMVGLIGVWAVRLIGALMNIAPVFPAMILGGAMVWALPGLSQYRPTGIDPATGTAVPDGETFACLLMIQLIFGFTATAGAAAVDWGAASRDARDVRLGGLVGVAFAPFVLATIALLIVAGAQGRAVAPAPIEDRPAFGRLAPPPRGPVMRPRAPGPAPPRLAAPGPIPAPGAVRRGPDTIGDALQHGIGGWAGGAMLMFLGLASLAPAVYAAFDFGHRFYALWPRLKRWQWTLIGGFASLPLVATGVAARLDLMFNLLGAAMAPVVGALAADFVRHRGAWPGPRRGVNPVGFLAWGVGLAVGLLPTIGRAAPLGRWSRFEPAAVFAFAAAFLAYFVLALVGLESPAAGDASPSQERLPADIR
jgi:cytosine permease